MNTSPDSSWFYSQNREKKGPIPFSDLQNLLSNSLPQSTLVWTDGMEDWLPASQIPELSGGSSPSSDENNPYAPPSNEILPGNSAGSFELGDIPLNPIPLETGVCISQAWKYTLKNLGNLIVLGLVFLILVSVVSGVLIGIASSIEGSSTVIVTAPDGSMIVEKQSGPLAFIANTISQIFALFLTLGALRYGHSLVKGETPEVGDLFSQGSKLLPAIGATILSTIAVIIGLILFILPGIFIALRFSLYQHAIVEKNMGAIDSLKYSFELTKGNTMSLLGLYILGFLITLAGILALLVGLIWAIPTVWLSSIIAFRYLHRGHESFQVIE